MFGLSGAKQRVKEGPPSIPLLISIQSGLLARVLSKQIVADKKINNKRKTNK